MTDQSQTPPKRPYETPRLLTFRDIKTLTQTTLAKESNLLIPNPRWADS